MASFKDIEHEIDNIMDIPFDEMDAAQQEAWLEYANELGTQEAAKIDSYSQFKRLGIMQAEALEAEGKRLLARARARRNNFANMDKYYMDCMKAHGLKKIKGNIYSISIRTTPVVKIDDSSIIPNDFWTVKTERSINKLAIRDALKKGEVVEGASMGSSDSLIVR